MSALTHAKRDGWYLVERWGGIGDVGVPCRRCDEAAALETYKHPSGDETRLFVVCDECGFSVEEREEIQSNDEEQRITMLAGHFAQDGCAVCHDLMAEFRTTQADEILTRLSHHVLSSMHLDALRVDEGGDE